MGLTERGDWFQSLWKPKEESDDGKEKKQQSAAAEGSPEAEKSKAGGGWFTDWLKSKLPGEEGY